LLLRPIDGGHSQSARGPNAHSPFSFISFLSYYGTAPAEQISFGVAPALLAFVVGLRTQLDTVVLTVFICCGLARLARFNATVALIPKNASGKSNYFEGLPIPTSLILVGLLAIMTRNDWIVDGEGVPGGTVLLWGNPGGSGEIHTMVFIFAAWSAAMVSKTLRVPKP
jgi:CDP-diacylglycerol--serine O-phosphatidyltransferase